MMEELKLFPDSEVFTKKRPTITEAQKKEFYLNVAQQIIDNKWTKKSDALGYVAELVEDIFEEDQDAFHLGRQFHDLGFKVSMDFCEAIVGWQDSYNSIIHNNVSNWIKAHDIKPKYKSGDKVIFVRDVFPYFKKDEIIDVYVSPVLNMAKYNIKGMSIEFETIEEHTELVNE